MENYTENVKITNIYKYRFQKPLAVCTYQKGGNQYNGLPAVQSLSETL